MKAINRLLISDVVQHWRQGLAISVLLACGIAIFVMSSSTIRSLDKSLERYYDQYQFADVFVQVTRAPESLVERLRQVPGVERVETRVVRSVIADLTTMVEPASCRLVSLADESANTLNGVHLLRGRWPRATGRMEVIAAETFAHAHQMQPGDTIRVVMNGIRSDLHVVGIGMSPEFVYATQPGLLLADNRRFGILWVPRRQLAAAFNMEGAFNHVSLKLRPRASVDDVLFHVDRIAQPYGGTGAYDRSDQESHKRVADELDQLASMAYVTPSIFLAVSAFLFNIVLSRVVDQQKEQIATLRAFGYRSVEIGWYYVKLIAAWVFLGALLGCLVGTRFYWWMTDEYVRYFRFPMTYYEFAGTEAAFATLIGLVAAGSGGFSAVRRAMRLPPAVAMRPEVPPLLGKTALERMAGSWMLSLPTRMIVRRMQARPRATTLSVLGIAMGFAVLVMGAFFEGTVNYLQDVMFDRSQRQDVTLTFNETASPDAVHDLRHLPGVMRVEPFRSVPIRLRHGQHASRLAVTGVDADADLYQVLNDREVALEFPSRRGIAITRALAEILEVRVGDQVEIEVLEGERVRRMMVVSAVFANYTEPAAYMNRGDLHRFLREGDRLSGAFVAIDTRQMPALYASVKQTPGISGITDKNAAMRNFKQTVSEHMGFMRTVNAIFAALIAFGVIYNCALITLAERGRDLATMRVMGFTRREVAFVLLGELALLTFLAIPLGMPIGYLFCYWATIALETESHRFPLVVSRWTYAYATSVIVLTATLSGFAVKRMLDRLDVIAVLKVKE